MRRDGRAAKAPGIYIDTGIAQQSQYLDPFPNRAPTSAASPTTVSAPPPTLRVSSTPIDPPISPLYASLSQKTSNKSNESRKLLAHVIGQLSSRVMPPTVYDSVALSTAQGDTKSFAKLVGTVKSVREVVKNTAKQPTRTAVVADDEEEVEVDGEFSTDATFELMSQLRDVLMISVLQGWQIFDDGADEGERPERRSGKSSSPFRRSLHPSGKRSRSPSPAFGGRVKSTELLTRCIHVLASVVSEDCRFKITSPRPTRPPHALQALTLKVAQFLLHVHRNNYKIVTQIASALFPAFFTFPVEMHSRLLAFFEESIIRGILDSLRLVQGVDHVVADALEDHAPDTGEQPMVSIRVEGADDDESNTNKPMWTPWIDSISEQVVSILSANAPLQGSAVYFLASLVPPLLAAVFDNIDFGTQSTAGIDVLHRLHRLMDLIVTSKADAYLDVLEIIAYHTPRARYLATTLLAWIWPKSIGHVTISRPLTRSTYLDGSPGILQDHSHNHQFVPWHFSSTRLIPYHECRSCEKTLNGFGLRCPFCACAVHFDCYDAPAGCHLVKYSMTSDTSVQKVALYRFSDVLANQSDFGPLTTFVGEHTFRYVNLFTLCLCTVCREPLWGCLAQGVRCVTCLQFVHVDCAVANPHSCRSFLHDYSHISIEWKILRQSCKDFYGDTLKYTRDELLHKTYEELSIIRSQLWVQLQHSINGVALGSIVILDEGKSASNKGLVEFELHHVLDLCEGLMRAETAPTSEALDEYLLGARTSRSKHNILFDWANLVYITSVLKTPHAIKTSADNMSDLLMVHQPDGHSGEQSKDLPLPFEIVSLSHLRNALGYEFNIHTDSVANFALQYLHHLGFFERRDRHPDLFHGKGQLAIQCTFPLPLGLDFSTDVETLFSAIESCLTDLDLSVNEIGFLLLIRRLPPNNMASDYALKRLMRALIQWVFAEDDNLATILREYVAKQQILPGVQHGREVSWPQPARARALPTSSAHNGGDYVAARRALLSQYALPWLQALHNEDIEAYGSLVFDLCHDLSRESTSLDDVLDPAPHVSLPLAHLDEIEHLNQLLRLLIRLAQHSVTFSVLDDLFIRWLGAVLLIPDSTKPVPSLVRLFPRDATETSYRTSTVDGSAGGGGIDATNIDPWRPVITSSTRSQEGLHQGLRWLYLYARTGIEISLQTYTHFSNAMERFTSGISESLLFVKTVMSSTWMKPTARNEVQDAFAALHGRHLPQILEAFKSGSCPRDILTFIRLTLGTCLVLYGCDRIKIQDIGIIQKEEIKDLPSRRKINLRSSTMSDPIIIPSRLMSIMKSYMEANLHEVSSIIAQFLHMFLSESPYLQPHEIDNFILRNGIMLSDCAWQLYGIQRDEVFGLRASFLIRTLVVDDQPFRTIVARQFRPGGDWLARLEGVARLFRIILDSTSSSFAVEDRLWQLSASEVFKCFFVALWADEKEEIRLAAETMAATMLPVHFTMISACWDDVLSKSPVEERTKLVSFLIQLRPHFPSWRVLSWKVIIETLLEDQYDEKNDQDGPASEYLSMYGLSSTDNAPGDKTPPSSDTSLLRVSLLILSLNMITDGIEIDYNDLLRLKLHLVRIVGFSNVDVTPTSSGATFVITFSDTKTIPYLAHPCVHELTRLLDAPFAIDPYPYTNVREEGTALLIGGPYVEVALRLFCNVEDIQSLPVLTLKSMLEGLAIVIYKQDVEKKMHLKHYAPLLKRAASRALDLLILDINYECRQLALVVVQSFIQNWIGPGLRPFVNLSIENVAKLIASQSHSTQDTLVAQSKKFIENTLSEYSNNGTFTGLLRRPLDREVFSVLRQIIDGNAKNPPDPGMEPLRERLLRDTLPRAVETNQADLQVILNNLQTYVEVVFHQGYSADLMMFVGQHLSQLARRSAEFPAHTISPTPILSMATILIQHNKALSRDMLTYTDAILRIVLNRLEVDTPSLSRVIQVTSALYRRTQTSNGDTPTNVILAVVFELLSDGLRAKARILPSTIKAMVEAIMNTEIAGHATPASLCHHEYPNLPDQCFTFLQYTAWADVNSDSDFTASLAIGNFILQSAAHDPSVMTRVIEQTIERSSSSRPSMTVRAWNILALAALMDTSETWINIVYRQLPVFALAHQAALKGYMQSGASIPDSAIADINHAYISIKLWLMVAQKRAAREEEGSATTFTVWNELWPPFEGLVNMFETEVQAGLSVTLAILTWSTVADLFIFIRTLHSPVAIHALSHIALLHRLMSLGRGEAHTAKLSRALRALTDPAPDVPVEGLINQVAKDLVAAEKLRVLEARRDVGRGVPERRNARGPSAFT